MSCQDSGFCIRVAWALLLSSQRGQAAVGQFIMHSCSPHCPKEGLSQSDTWSYSIFSAAWNWVQRLSWHHPIYSIPVFEIMRFRFYASKSVSQLPEMYLASSYEFCSWDFLSLPLPTRSSLLGGHFHGMWFQVSGLFYSA